MSPVHHRGKLDPVHNKDTETRDRQQFTLTLSNRDNLVTKQHAVHVFGLLEETRVPGENIRTPHRKTAGGRQTCKSSKCEATAPTTAL